MPNGNQTGPMTLQKIREYPQYKDRTDLEISEAVHKQHYSDIPFDEFAGAFGYKSTQQDPVDTTTGLTNIPARISLSFIDDAKKKEQFLGELYDDVRRLPDGRLTFKNPETGKPTTVDEEGRSLKDLADWVGLVPEIGYSTVGAIAGALSPVPGGAILGAGGGMATGKFVKGRISQGLMGEDLGLDPSDEEIKEYLKSGAAGGVGEGVGGAVIKGLSPFAKKITPTMMRAKNYFAKFGGRMTPAQATEQRMLDLLENVTESSLFGGGRFREFRLKQDELLGNIADDIVERFVNGATPEQAGLLAQQVIGNKKVAFGKAGSALYRQVDKLTEGAVISTTPLKKEAARLLKKAQTVVNGKELAPSLKNATTERILNDFAKLPDEVPFSFLQKWRSELMQIGYAPTDLIPGKTAGMAKHLSGVIDGVYSNAEKGLTGDALAALRKANTFWKTGKEKFNDKLIKSLAQKDASALSGVVFKKGAVESIRKVRNVLSKDAWMKLRGTYTSKLLLKDSVGGNGMINGNKLLTNLRNTGKSTLNEIFTKVEQTELKNFAHTLRLVQNRPPGLGGGMLIQLTQAGAIMSLPAALSTGTSALSATSGVILLGPSALARIFTNRAGIKWLTDGLVQKRGTKEAIKLTTRLLSLAGKENVKLLGGNK